MKLRPDLLLFAGLLLFTSGCAGTQWNEHLVEGNDGPVTVIRLGAHPSSKVGAQQDPQAAHGELQERLLKMSAMLPMQHYSDYVVGPEDVLEVGFLGAKQLDTFVRVNGDGEIRLLLVGNVHVAGLTPSETVDKLTRLYKGEGYLVDPQISVAVKEFRHSQVAVSGAVQKSGYLPLVGPRSLLEILGMAGGLSPGAGDTVNVIRQHSGASKSADPQGLDAETMVVDLNKLLIKGDLSLNIPILNGDVVFVPYAQSAYVIGSVLQPGNVLLQGRMTLTRAIIMRGGENMTLSSRLATILRVDKSGKREVLPVKISQVLKGEERDPVLEPNDIVYVHESKTRQFLSDFKNLWPIPIPAPAY